MSIALNFLVKVTTVANRPLSDKDWEPIARRIAKAARGSRSLRQVSVWVDAPYHLVAIDEHGRTTVKKGGFDLAFEKATPSAST